jgi:hypothetical protein
MPVKTAATLFTLTLFSTACQPSAGPSKEKQENRTAETKVEGKASIPEQDWQRMMECSEHVNRILKREHLDRGSSTLLGTEYHYSSKYNRCFLRFSYSNPRAKDNPAVPTFYYELWDANEEKLLSICTDQSVSGGGTFSCTVQDKDTFRKCDVCRECVHDRMTN